MAGNARFLTHWSLTSASVCSALVVLLPRRAIPTYLHHAFLSLTLACGVGGTIIAWSFADGMCRRYEISKEELRRRDRQVHVYPSLLFLALHVALLRHRTGGAPRPTKSLAVLVAMAMCYLIWNDPRRVYVGVPPVLMYAVTPATAVLWLRLLARIQPPRVRSSGIA